MSEKLTWDQIKARYNEEWVELIDYDWADGTPWPKAGIVRVHAPERREFWRLANTNKPRPKDSAIVFVGPPDPPGVIRNNPMTITTCEK